VKKQTERRFFKSEFRVSAPGEPDKIGGYAAVFDSPSENLGYYQEVREEIDPRAFDTVIAANPDVRGLFNHDANFVLGRTTSGTLRLSIDARGLAYEIDPPDTQFAKDLMVSMRRKDITGSSFGFVCKRDQWTDNQDGSVTRRILEFDELFDVSPVTFPAYTAASSEARTLPASMPKELRARFEKRDANANGCECACEECQDGDCANCSEETCDDPNCDTARSLKPPPADSGADKEANANRRLAVRVALNITE
jgi:HK97 family phage prohead protease